MRSVAVLGAGSWGTALAIHLARIGHQVRLWARDAEFAAEMEQRRANAVYLPDITFPAALSAGASLPAVLRDAQLVLVAVPSHGVRQVLRQAGPHVDAGAVVLSATKGLEDGSLLRMSQVIAEEWPARGGSSGVVGPELCPRTRATRCPPWWWWRRRAPGPCGTCRTSSAPGAMRLYASTDVVGVELGGALKNVIAIAAGVVDGLGLGHNALAALITRGLAEISRLAVAAGGDRETLAGLAGMGDLVLTCTGSSAAIATSAWSLRAAVRSPTSSPARRWWPKACARPAPRSRWAPPTASSCRLPRRSRRCSAAGSARPRP